MIVLTVDDPVLVFDQVMDMPYPVILSGGGKIISFGAEFEGLFTVDMEMAMAAIPHVYDKITQYNQIVNMLKQVSLQMGAFMNMLAAQIGIPEISFPALEQPTVGVTSTDIIVTLWHLPGGQMGIENQYWNQLAQLYLSPMITDELAHITRLADRDMEFANELSALIECNEVSSMVSPMNFRAMSTELMLDFQVNPGDYLMVGYRVGGATAPVSGIVAKNAIASVTIHN